MNRNVLRSVGAIAFGSMAFIGSYIAMMMVINLLNRVTFGAGAQFSAGWVLVALSMWFLSSVVSGFVAGAIAQRREMEHAVGLALFTLVVPIGISIANKNPVSGPNSYTIVGCVGAVLFTLLGGWMRMKQRVLLAAGSEAMMRATEHVRLPAAILAALATFVLVFYVTGPLGILGLGPILDRLLGKLHPATGMLPCFLTVLLSGFSAQYVFKKIMGERAAPSGDGTANGGSEG